MQTSTVSVDQGEATNLKYFKEVDGSRKSKTHL